MGVFAYTARDRGGRAVSGTIESQSARAASARLREMGYAVTSLREPPRRAPLSDIVGRLRGVPMRDVAVFTRQLGTMVDAGLTLIASLAALETQRRGGEMWRIIGDVRRRVEAGVSLSEALEAHPDVFSQVYVNMVRAGEVSGTLDDALARVAQLLEKELALRQKVTAAMTYPVIVAAAAAIIVSVIVFLILPKFADMFAQLNVPLPAPTRCLIVVTVASRRFWYVIVLALVSAVYGARYVASTPRGRAWVDGVLPRVPLIGPVISGMVIARWCRIMGTLVRGGVPIMQALGISARAVHHIPVSRAMLVVQGSVREGKTIAAPLRASGVFPPMVVQMVAVGEETGALDVTLAKAADFFESEVEYAVSRLTASIEPMLIVVLGVIVGSIVVSFYLPLFNLVGAIK